MILRPRRFEAAVIAAFVLAGLIVVSMAVVTWKVSRDAIESSKWTAHTYRVIGRLAATASETHLIELSTQAYRVTGNVARLAERDAAIGLRESLLQRIEELTADNPVQQKNWKRLRAVVDERLAIARRVEELRSTEGEQAASAYAARAPLQETRQRLLDVLATMEFEERRLLQERSEREERAGDTMAAAATATALALIALLAGTYVLILRELRTTEASRLALAVSEESLATTLHSIGDAVLATDAAGRVTRMNPIAEQLTGWTAAQAHGQPIDTVFRIVNEYTRAPTEVPVAKVLATGKIQGLANHTVLIARDGTEWPIADSAAPIRDASGNVDGVVLVFREVSAERLAERLIQEQSETLERRVLERTAALRASEERMRLVTESVRDYAILLLDVDGRVVTWNAGAEAITGYAEDGIVGRHFSCLFPPEDIAAGKPAEELAAASAGHYQVEALRLRKNGTAFWADVVVTPVRDESGALLGYVKITRDISERKQAEALLHLQSAALAAAVNGILITAIDGTILWANPAITALTGYTLDELRGRNPRLFSSGRHGLDFYRALHETVRSGNIWQGEIINRRKDGSLYTEEMSITPLHADGGPITHFIAIKQDITERKRVESALRESESRFRATIDRSPVPFVLDDGMNITYVNEAFVRTFGYEPSQVPTLEAWWPQAYPDPVYRHWVIETWRARIDETKRTGAAFKPLEVDIRCSDGSTRTVLAGAVPLKGSFDNLYLVSLFDISEQKRHQDEISALNANLERRVAERTRELEEASRAKSDFLANMSHELRTPLNSIIGCSEMLKDGVLGALEGKQLDFVTDILDAGTHLLALINDILDLSKVEAGALQLEDGTVHLPGLLRASILVVRERAIAHNIRLDTDIDAALGTIVGDERKLKQILYNLLSNAVKFSQDGGVVRLAARRCTAAEVVLDDGRPGRLLPLLPGAPDDFLHIAIEDSGIGIGEENLSKLFEAFTQVDSSVARQHAGTGLGLALVRRLVELHGGTVGVTSRSGAGSCFSVWLPYRVAASNGSEIAPAAPAAARLPAPAVPLALVVEDDDRMASQISAQLRAEGFTVIRAATAEEGLVRASKERPQLITLDIYLPEMDGWEFMRRVKANPALAATPVVIITISQDRSRALALGARRVLNKPFTSDELVATLAGVLDTRPEAGTARVLVVDNNVQAVELVAAALESAGHHALRAYGGAEAIQAAHSDPPDLVILDINMPEVDGFEVARALCDSERTANIPILVLTAMDLGTEARSRFDSNVNAILTKSALGSGELLDEVRRAIAARRSA